MISTGTTDANGLIILDAGTAGSYTVTATETSGRFASFSQLMTLACGQSVNVPMTAASGYECVTLLAGCLYPVPDTLTLTDSVIGTCTLTFAGGSWKGSIIYTYPGFANLGCLCACNELQFWAKLLAGLEFQVEWRFAVLSR